MGPDRTRISGWGTPQRPRHRDTSSRIRKWRRSGRKKILFTPREPILSSRYTVSSLYRTLFSNSPFRRLSSHFSTSPERRETKKKKRKEKWRSCVCGQGDGRSMETAKGTGKEEEGGGGGCWT